MSTPQDVYNNIKTKYQNYISYVLQRLREFRKRYSDIVNKIVQDTIPNVKKITYRDTDIVYPAVMADPGRGVPKLTPPRLSLSYTGPLGTVNNEIVPSVPQFTVPAPTIDPHTIALRALAQTIKALAPAGAGYGCEYSDSNFEYCNLNIQSIEPGITGLTIASQIVFSDYITVAKYVIPQGATLDGDSKIWLRREVNATTWVDITLIHGEVDLNIEGIGGVVSTKMPVIMALTTLQGTWKGVIIMNKICPSSRPNAVIVKGLGQGGKIVCW